MALVSIPILGRASGKFADSEFYRLKNKNVLRSSKLKRYKQPSLVVSDYQLLLKLIVALFMPISDFLKTIYHSDRRYLNYFNYLIKHNYSNFYLSPGKKLLVNDITKLRLNNSNVSLNVSSSIISYNSTSLTFSLNMSESDRLVYTPAFVVLFSYNLRSSLFLAVQTVEPDYSICQYFYHEPPFSSLDYDAYIVFVDYANNYYALPIYMFEFTHG